MVEPTSGVSPTRIGGFAANPYAAPAQTPAATGDQIQTGGADPSQPHQDQAAASVIQNLPRPCPDGCCCSACNPADPMSAFKARDQEVEQHEQAHQREAGEDAASGPVYDTQMGPDGKSYRVGGHVEVNLKEDDNDPKKTLEHMQRVKKAALAPQTPSAQDVKVAGEADQKAAKAQAKLDQKQHKAPGTSTG